MGLLLMLGLGIGNQVQAQYNTGIGIRGALGPGLTIKHHIEPDVAIEGILSSWYRGVVVTGLYEQHFPALGVDNLRWYLGGGAHVGFWTASNGRPVNNPWFAEGNGGVAVGLDAIGGIEYTIPDLPINISADWKPGFNLIGYTGFWVSDAALSVRYVF